MKFITFLKKQLTLVFVVGMLLCLASCGSFQYSGIYDDGIYGNSNVVQQPTEYPQGTVKNTSNSNTSSDTSNYYTTYFKEKSLQIADDNTVFTDVDSYQGSYEDGSANANNYAGWGENNSNNVVINIYDNGPYYGNIWGLGYRNNWGWNLGWNNWGYNSWFPYQYDPWYSPFCNYGYNNFGYNNYGYSNYRYNNSRGRLVSYVNGQRGITPRNSSLSSRSLLSTTNRNASTSRARTRSAIRSNNGSRSSTRTTRSRSTVSNPNTRSTYRNNYTTRPTTRKTTTETSDRALRPNTTTRSTRSSTRSSSPTRTRSRSTTSSSRSSSRSSSSRRRN